MSSAGFTVDGERYEFTSNFTFGEMAAFEKTTGVPYADMQNSKTILVTQALVWIAMKRKNPTLKFGDLDDVAIESIEWDNVTDDDGIDPKDSED